MARRRRNPEIIAGRVASDGTIVSGDGFTCVKTGTGALSFRFPASFRLIGWSAISSAGAAYIYSGAVGGGIDTQASAGDAGVSFVAVGVQQ